MTFRHPVARRTALPGQTCSRALPRRVAAAALLAACGVLAAPGVWAQAAAPVPNPGQADLLLRQEQERLRLEQERLRREPPPSGVDLKDYAPGAPRAPEGGVCHNISSIDLSGASLLDEDEQAEIVTRFVQRCLNARDIEQLMAEVTRHYIARGFVTSRAYLPGQDLSKGQLRLLVLEGRIQRLEVTGDPEGRIHLGNAVPAQAGDLLNIRDLEQAVDQINAVPGNQVKLDLVPGSQPGQTVVVFRNQAGRAWRGNLAYNNQGAPSTGRDSVSGGLALGSLLRLGETLEFTVRSSPRPGDDEESSSSVSVGATLPSGNTTYSVALAQSRYSTGFDTQLGQHLISSGRSTTLDLKAERLIQRDQDGRHLLTLGYSGSDSKNFINGTLIGVNSARTHAVGMGLRSVLFTQGGVLSLKPELVLGTAAQDNLPAGVNPARNGPQAQFAKLGLDVQFNRGFKLAAQELSWTSVFKAQASAHQLFETQKLLLGSVSSVRAYARHALSGDSGFYWRNDLSWHTRYQMGGQELKARWYAGLDTGHVRNHGTAATRSGSMSGAALGVSASLGAVSLDLSVTRPFHSTGHPDTTASRVWLGLSVEL